jgi:hypothetical protein
MKFWVLTGVKLGKVPSQAEARVKGIAHAIAQQVKP